MVMTQDSIDRWLRVCCVSGAVGSALFLTGDMLFYGAWTSGAAFHPLDEMARKPVGQLLIGGAVGPLASLASAIGMGLFAITLRSRHPRAASVAACFLAAMMLIGGSYHAVYTEFGLAARLAEPMRTTMISQITNLRDEISYPMYGFGLAGTLMVYWLGLRDRTRFPRRLLILMPTTLSMMSDVFRVRGIAYPVGGLIRGGWINGSFFLFFAVATVVFWGERATGE